MTARVFTTEDQLAFARLSGDSNPLHMDPIAARRLMLGRQVVHGLHALLWSLDNCFETYGRALKLLSVKASFQNGIGVGQRVSCSQVADGDGRIEIKLKTATAPVTWIQIRWEPSDLAPAAVLPVANPEPLNCREQPLDHLPKAAGSLPLFLDSELAKSLFPNLMRVLPPPQLAELLATTRLVGMECPGLNSIFAGFELTFALDGSEAPMLDYRVVNCNSRLSLLEMAVKTPGMQGKIKAFLRPKPQQQVSFTEVGREVESGEFSAQKALIIGGSRGLGEVAAKVLAAGGAEVILTYWQGEQDAQGIVKELVSNGANAICRRLNVLASVQDLPDLDSRASKPLYLYYFATPFIFGAVKGNFSTQRFSTFTDYYITGFARVVETLAGPARGLKKIFYPSTTAINEIPLDMGEYAAAKAAGETLCAFLEKARPAITFYKPRLPRLATDQTVSLLPVNNQEPVSILLSHLRHLRDL